MPSYSFQDNMAAISGPNGAFTLGYPSGNAEGGITITMTEDKNTMNVGADGSVMHSLHSGKSGTVTVRYQKTSPTNAQLSTMYALDTAGAATHGKNTITLKDLARGDDITCEQCAFARFPNVTYAKDGGEMEWVFHAGRITFKLGDGIAETV